MCTWLKKDGHAHTSIPTHTMTRPMISIALVSSYTAPQVPGYQNLAKSPHKNTCASWCFSLSV